jgi:signal transduction histidine kinase
MIWFRRERHFSVRWSGDPDQAHVVAADGRLSPRKSFAQFIQDIRGCSLPWSPEEVGSAAELGSLIDIEALREREAFARTILNSSPEHIAVLDRQGTIVEVNSAWKRFAEENDAPAVASHSIGLNYRDVCLAAAARPDGGDSLAAWSGIQGVLDKTQDHFALDYPCHSPTERHWFRMRVYPLIAPSDGAVVTHENITARKRAEERLLEMAAGLETTVARRTEQLRRLSAQLAMTEERERRQLAEELHDNLGQFLAIAKIKLSSLAGAADRSALDEVLHMVDRADQSARLITQQLSPPILRTLGLVPALEALAETMEAMYRLNVALDLDARLAAMPLNDEIQALVYRSLRELLINVARHAKVTQASVVGSCEGNHLMFSVSDDGEGFDAAGFLELSSAADGFGLRSVHERITGIGGKMDIDSSPGNGTTITLAVPPALAAAGAQP